MKADLNYKLILIIFLLKISIMDFLAELSSRLGGVKSEDDPGGPNLPSFQYKYPTLCFPTLFMTCEQPLMRYLVPKLASRRLPVEDWHVNKFNYGSLRPNIKLYNSSQPHVGVAASAGPARDSTVHHPSRAGTSSRFSWSDSLQSRTSDLRLLDSEGQWCDVSQPGSPGLTTNTRPQQWEN